MVELQGISKAFGPVRANSDISLSFYPGVIKALLGENGAGKSTLMSMLAGRLQPDSGSIIVDGQARRFSSSKDAFGAGIGMVYQHFMLVDTMTVAENVMLGQEEGFFISPRKMEEKVARLAEQFSLGIDPSVPVSGLSMGERQRVEILKLLARDSRLLIFDEPTAVLTQQETELLFITMRRMTEMGKSIVFISHKLQEVMDISDEIAILRAGRVVDEFDRDHVPDKAGLAKRMIGRSVEFVFSRSHMEPGENVLEVRDLVVEGLGGVSLELRKGEVLAIAGVAGNGQKPLVEVLAGLQKPPRGSVSILGEDWHSFYPEAPKVGGLAYIPEDRQGLATCQNLSLVDNMLLTARAIFTDGLFLTRSAALASTLSLISGYSIVPGNPKAPARSLSGGNLQKLVIGRELLRQPSVIIAENPTQGLDVAATEDVWKRLNDARAQAGILLVTNDIVEALQLADRIAVMYRGHFVDCFDRNDERKVEAIGLMLGGVHPDSLPGGYREATVDGQFRLPTGLDGLSGEQGDAARAREKSDGRPGGEERGAQVADAGGVTQGPEEQ